MIIVLAVPSSNTYIKATGHMSSLEEVAPYHIYADVVILHNPIETGDKHMLVRDRGFCKSTYWNMLPKDEHLLLPIIWVPVVSIGYFLYPENGHIMELPTSEK
jgi:hypothetical protein